MSRIDQNPDVPAGPRFGLLLTFRATAAYLGLSETRLREVRALLAAASPDELKVPRFPQPVQLPGPDPAELYRREDIEEWVRALRPVERQRVQRGAAA